MPENPASRILQKHQAKLCESLNSMQPNDLHEVMTVLWNEELITEEDKMAFTRDSNVESIMTTIKTAADSKLESLDKLSTVLLQYSKTEAVAEAIKKDYGTKFYYI